MDENNFTSNITKDLNLGTSKKSKKNTSSKNPTNNLSNSETPSSHNFVYMDKSKLEENENNLPAHSSNDPNSKIAFADVLKNFNLPSMLNETTQTKMKKTLKNFVANKDTSKVEIKFEDTESKLIERVNNYESMVKEVSKYQPKVKINREADVLDFSTNQQNLSFTTKTLINNSSAKDMNSLEKSIKDILTKNKYDTEDKIIEEENKKLMTVNPEELKKRYEELKRVKSLLFQQEMKNKRQSKIKSKLFHKIKNKQKDREERLLLEQLETVDAGAVKNYLEKKKLDRIKERIELKHSFNSKFSKTVKRYNLHKDEGMKEAIKDNLKMRDELLKKIKGNDEGLEGSDEEEIDDENLENENENDIYEDEEGDEEFKENLGDEMEIDENNLLINFDQNEENQKNEKNAKNKNTGNEKGVWGMKFMQNDNLDSKLKQVLNEMDSDEDEFDYHTDEEIAGNKKQKIELEENSDEDGENNAKKLNINKNTKILNGRRKNIIEDEFNNNPISGIKSQNNNKVQSANKKITSDMLNELNNDAKKFIKDENIKVDLNGDDLKKLVQMEDINDDEEYFQKFLIENNENKNEFLTEAKPKINENEITKFSGWGSWAGESKVIQAKEFLKKKRYMEIQQKKQSMASQNTNSNPYVKVNNSFDKKFSNYMVKELPNNVRSQEEFEKLNGTAFGREWNSLTMYKKLIQPNIVKKIGQIIEPMKINDNTTAKKLCEIIEKATKKKQRTKSKI